MAVEPGKNTTEWKITKWIAFACGLGSVVTGAIAGALPVSGAVEVSHPSVLVLGIAATVLGSIGGAVVKEYIKVRGAVKTSDSE